MNHSLLQPPSSSSASTAASSFAAAMAGGVVVGCHLQYELIVHRLPSTCVVLDEDIFLLHDPFAGQSFPLPRTSARSHYRAVCLSASSSTPDSYPHKFPPNFVAAVAEPSWLVLIYRPDLDDDWKVALNTPKAQDLIFHGDELYCVNREREIRAIHVRTPNLHVNADRTVVRARGHHNETMIMTTSIPTIILLILNPAPPVATTFLSCITWWSPVEESCCWYHATTWIIIRSGSKCTGWWRKVGWWKWSTWATTCCL